jgi:hypothetical protein
MLQESQSLYERLRTAVMDPVNAKKMKRKISATKQAVLGRSPSSFYEDHEQFIERNTNPFQEITIHEESVVPEGGNAPVKQTGPVMLLDLNRTADAIAFQLLEKGEKSLLKDLDKLLASR